MFYKVKSVKPLENFILLIDFENGVQKYYDVKKLFDKFTYFQDLLNINGLFEQVKVEAYGYAISWNDDLDIACNELWNNGFTNT